MKAMLKGITKGLPQTGIQGGAGVGLFYIHRMLANKFPSLQKHPLVAPIGFIIAGHVIKKKAKWAPVGAALIGAGGYAGAQAFELSKANAPAPAASGTSGVDDNDTGMVVGPGEVGMLLEANNIGDLDNGPASSYQDAYEMSSV